MNLRDLVIYTYVEGTKATKLTGRDAIEHPDFKARLSAADKLSEFLGWSKSVVPAAQTVSNQFNFFSMPKDERDNLNDKLKTFLDGQY